MTDGFSGSDLKSFCVAAGYQPIRELLDAEKATRAQKPLQSPLPPDLGSRESENIVQSDTMDIDTERSHETEVRVLKIARFLNTPRSELISLSSLAASVVGGGL